MHARRYAVAILSTLAAVLAPAAGAGAAVDPTFMLGPDGVIAPEGTQNQTDRVVIGDFNGDGNLDVAAAFQSFVATHPLAVALGDGTGHLGSFNTIASPMSEPVIATADFNGDGRSDLVVGAASATGVSVLLADAGGAFSAAPSSPLATAGNTASIATDDFNGDGAQDIAVLVAGSPGHVAVFLGDGAGHFTAATNSPFASGGNAAAGPRFQERLVTADFNSDHHPDVALVNSAATANIVTMLGDGHGALGTATSVSAENPHGLATGDLTGDSLPDLAFYTTSGVFNTGVSDGAGGFTSFTPFTTSPAGAGVAVSLADLNGDGKLDAAATNGGLGRVDVLKGTGSTPWVAEAAGSPYDLLLGGTQPANNTAVGDVNGDGRPDLAVSLDAGNLAVLLNTTPIPLATTGPPSAVHDTNATVTGKVDPNGLSTTYAIELRNPGGATVTPAPAGTLSGSGPQAVSASITGLSPSTTYQYRVTATNSNGTARGLWRSFTTTVALPANTSPPQLSGSAVSGQTLTCTPGTWTDSPTFSFQWTRGGVPIAGAMASTYPVTPPDVGSALACVVTATNPGGSANATSPTLVATAALARPAATRRPRVVGRAVPGRTVACDAGAWSTGGSFGYRWLRDGRLIRGAASVLYGVVVLDGGHRLACRVTVTNAAGGGSADSPGVSVRATKCVVPPVAGLTPSRAKRSLVTAGCRAGGTRKAHSRRVRKGRVIGSVPKAGAVKPLHTRVTLIVSSGR